MNYFVLNKENPTEPKTQVTPIIVTANINSDIE